MADRKDIIKNASQQQGQQQTQQGNKTWKDIIKSEEQQQPKRKQLINGDTITEKQAVANIKKAADENERHRYGIVGDMREGITGLFGGLGDLAEYGWTYVTNKNEDQGINDFKKYNEYSKKMSESKTEEEYSEYYKKMIDEGVINEAKYNEYIDKQKDGKDYKFNQAKEVGKNVFNNKFEEALSPIMKQATNRYQIDAISKGIKEIEDQYSMAFENTMNAYNDTRDDRILEEWLKTSKEYEDNITRVTKQWANKIIAGKTYGEAYSETISDAANKELANDIVSLERSMTNKLYKYTLERNFNDAGEYASTGNLLQAVNSAILGAKNLVTWGLQQLSYGTEELKQGITGRYDVTEELANLYVFDENASAITKTLGSAQWVGNWLLDSLPQLGPLVGEILLTRKVPGSIMKTLDKATDAVKGTQGLIRAGNRRINRVLSEFTMDNLVYDTSFQTIVGHPITGEEENLNLIFNGIIDSAQAMLYTPAKYFNNSLKPEDIINDTVSAEALNIAKKLDDKNAKILAEELVLLRGKEITQGTSANKARLNNSFSIEELRKTEPEVVAKYEKIQKLAYDYTDRIRNNRADIDDILLAFEEMKGRKAAKNTPVGEQIKQVVGDVTKRANTLKQLGDYIFSGAKAISQTFKNALADGRITEGELRAAINGATNVKGVDDLVLGLVKQDSQLRQLGLEAIQASGKLSKEQVNQIYNSAIIDLLKNKGDILKEDEWLGKFKKNSKGEYVDVYGVLKRENGEDTYNAYSYDEIMNYLQQNITKEAMGAEKYRISDALADAYDELTFRLKNDVKVGEPFDFTDTFRKIENFDFDNFANKTVAEQSLLKSMLSENGFKMKLDANKNIINIEIAPDRLKRLYEKVQGLQNKGLHQFDNEDIGAYKMLFFGEIYGSFKSYLSKLQIEGGNAKQLLSEFQTYFEKQFNIVDGKYTLKAIIGNDDNAVNSFKELFGAKATYKETENMAANNLIRNILKEANLKNDSDKVLYTKIKDLVCQGRYLKETEKEALPIVNSLFNQAKWMKDLGMGNEAIEEITRVFGEVIVDRDTITALSNLGSDYLYKTVISKLVLENNLGAGLYKDSLMKLIDGLSRNATKENKDLINSINELTKKINNLTLNISDADKTVFLNRVWDAFDISEVKLSKAEWKSEAVNINKGIYNIPEPSKMTDDDINNLSTLIATSVFHRNNLPYSRLLDRLKASIKNSLENARNTNRGLEFSIGQTLKETEGINLSLLGDMQLAQLLKNPDNMLQAIISKWHIQKKLDGLEMLPRKVGYYSKEWGKALKFSKIGKEYRDIITGLKGLFEGGFDKDVDELVDKTIDLIEEHGINDLGNVRDMLVELGKRAKGVKLSARVNTFGRQLDYNIEKLDDFINLLNTPGNSKRAEEMATKLEQVKALMERGKVLITSNKGIKDFESDIAKSFDDISHLGKAQFNKFNGVVNESETVQNIWDLGRNEIHYDSPYKMKWKGLEGKKFVILDTETTGLEEEAKVIQLSYRVVQVKPDGTVELVGKPRNEYYKWPEDMSEWAKENAIKNKLENGKEAFGKGSELYKELEKLAKENDTYFVGHNIQFDFGRMANGGIKLPMDKAISTDLISTALIPVGIKNHKQETIVEMFKPIKDAVSKMIEDEHITGISEHNAIVDTLELQSVLGYLINHAIKNEKTTEEELFNFLLDTSKKMSGEKRSANALPFYNFESRRDYQKFIKNKYSGYAGRNIVGTADWTFDMSWLLNQMFGSNSTRKDVGTFLEEFNKKFPNSSKELNIYDTIDGIADKLGDEKSLFILNNLKKYVDEEDVIEANKIYLGEEVKDAYVKFHNINPDVSFPEYCTNRIVANILASKGMYNEDVIRSLNNGLAERLQDIAKNKLVYNDIGTLDTEAFLIILNRMNDEGMINLGERGSGEYARALTRILEKVRGTNIKKADTGVQGDTGIYFTKDGLTFALSEFNKELYQQITKGNNAQGFGYAAADLFRQLFGDDVRQGGKVVFEGGLFPEYAVKRVNSQIIADKSMPVEQLTPEEIDTVGQRVVGKMIPDEFSFVLGRNKTYETWQDVYNELENIDNGILGMRERANAMSMNFSKRRISVGNQISELKKSLEEGKVSFEEYEKSISNLTELEKKFSKLEKIASDRYKKLQKVIDEVEDELANVDEMIDRGYGRTIDINEYVERKLNQYFDDAEDAVKEILYDEEDKGVVDVYNRQIENQGAAETARLQGSSIESQWSNEFIKIADDPDFGEDIFRGNTLLYDNKFLIDETDKSVGDLNRTSLNGIIYMLARGNVNNKEEMVKYLQDEYDNTVKELEELEGNYNKVRKYSVKYKGKIDDYKKRHKEEYKDYEEYLQKNSKKSFLYNALNVFKGGDASLNAIKLADNYGFGKELIGAKTHGGTIKRIDINVKVGNKEPLYAKQIFGDGEFTKEGFMDAYADALNSKGRSRYVIVNYTLDGVDGKEHNVTDRIRVNDLFDTSFGQYILKEYGVPLEDVPKGEWDNTLPAISAIKNKMQRYEQDPRWNMFRTWHNDGKEGPWYEWNVKVGNSIMPDEKIWIEGIGYSDKKYAYIYKGLNERQRAKLNEILGDKDVEQYVKENGTRKLDDLINEAGYDSAEELIYKKVILPAAQEGKKQMKDWRATADMKSMMKDIVKAKNADGTKSTYAKNVDRAYKTPTAFYKLDNYIFKNDKTLEYTVQHDKILAFSVEEDGKKLHVIGYEPQFYRVSNELEVDPSVVAMKEMNDEYLPDNPDDLGKDIVAIVYPGEYISTKEEREDLLRRMDIDNATKSDGYGGTFRSEYRDTFEYVHDMDEVKVLLEDENTGLRYEGVLEIKRFQKNIDENGVAHSQPGMMRLKNVEESESKGKVSIFEKNKVQNEERRKPENDQPMGNWQQMDWENSAHELKTKDVDMDIVRDMEEQSGIVKVPTDTKEVIAEDNKHLDDDGELILNVNPLSEKEKQIWNTRLLNFTNYDVVENSNDLKQIVGLRSLFVSQHGKDLRKAIDDFNNAIKEYSDEDQEKIYNSIRNKAVATTQNADSSSRELNPGIANMEVNGLPSELQNKLNAIGKVFYDGGWNPQYQYLMLSKKNDGFEGIMKNIGHNHKGAAAEYLRATGGNLRNRIRNLARENGITGERAINNLVSDIVGDPLGVGTMNKMLMSIRSLWRFVKYGPILFPLSGVMMLANSAILGITRYGSEGKGFRRLMGTDAFNILTAPKGETVKLSNGKTAVGLGFTDSLNRTNEIMFNSNSDLGGSWFDKVLDLMISPLPEGKLKNVVTTAMKGGTHSLFDIAAQGSVKSMEFAKALEKNLVGWGDINQFVKAVADGTVDDAMIRNILADTEKGYSRFFTNSATTLFSRHKFSRMYMFNALQGYVINRTDEIFSSIKDAVNWIGRRNGNFNWNDFTNYLQYDNQELKGLLMNVLLSAKLGFYMDRLVNGGEFNAKEYSDYMIDTSDYLSSIPATFFYGILTAPISGIEDYAEYVKMNNEDFSVGQGLTVAGLNTISEVFSKFFREGKVLNAMASGIVAFGKTGNIDFSYDVLESEFSNIANGLGRFQLTEGTHKYGLDYMTNEGDMLGKLLFNSDKTSDSGRITNKLYSLQTVDGILNGENGDWWKNRLLPYIPVLGPVLQNAITGQGYTFTQAKRKELQHIMDKDKVVQTLNNWDAMTTDGGKEIWWDKGVYTDEAVGRMYKELTAFDYPNKQRISGTDFKTGYEGELEQLKETVFTDELMRGLGWSDEDLTNFLNTAGSRKEAGLMKIMAAAQASRPGSSKIILSYLANQREYNLLKEVTGKDYPSTNDVTPEQMAVIQRQVLEEYYPYMFLADKTSWYKAITEYVSNKYDVFKDLYKDDDLTGYLSTLGYMDMIMYQQAREGNVNAKYIKNSWTMLSKYFKSEPARLNAINYVMDSIEHSGFSEGRATAAKMGVLAANMDFYDRIQKSGMMQALYSDDIERYNNFVWGVLKDINKQGLDLSSENKKYSGNKYYKPYSYQNGMGNDNVPMAQKFVPAAQKYLNGRTPSTYTPRYRPNTYSPSEEDFNWHWKYYERLIKDYTDKLVKSEGKKYPAQTIEGMTFKTGSNNRGSIKGQQLTFPKHKSKEYRTNVLSNLPGSHG